MQLLVLSDFLVTAHGAPTLSLILEMAAEPPNK
jgi:hypothetical protein